MAAGTGTVAHGEAILTGILSLLSAWGVAWFGVLKDRKDRRDPTGDHAMHVLKELADAQESLIDALKEENARLKDEVQELRQPAGGKDPR